MLFGSMCKLESSIGTSPDLDIQSSKTSLVTIVHIQLNESKHIVYFLILCPFSLNSHNVMTRQVRTSLLSVIQVL